MAFGGPGPAGPPVWSAPSPTPQRYRALRGAVWGTLGAIRGDSENSAPFQLCFSKKHLPARTSLPLGYPVSQRPRDVPSWAHRKCWQVLSHAGEPDPGRLSVRAFLCVNWVRVILL